MIYLKIDVMEALKQHGYTQYKIRKEGALGAKTVQELKAGNMQGTKTLDTICRILDCQPGDIIGWKPDEE